MIRGPPEPTLFPSPPLFRSWETPEGIAVPPLFTPADLADVDFLHTYPGIAPYLRGPYPTMYTTQPWTVRQYAGFSTAAESDRKSTRLNSSHANISYAVFCLK